MSTNTKMSEQEHIKDLERSQVDEIDKAEIIVAKAGVGQAPTSIRLSAPLLQALDRLACAAHRKRSNLIQHILWEYVRAHEH